MTAFSLPQDRAAVQDTHIHHLRHQIESRLKVGPRTQRLATLKPILVQVSLGEDLAASLTDGVVLCHIANHCSPRSVSSIHVPSPAVVSLLLLFSIALAMLLVSQQYRITNPIPSIQSDI